MFKLFGGLKDYFKVPEVIIDSPIFRLHNLFTTALLLTCSLVITATQYVGKPIECIVNGLPTHPINTYCWITSTFTMPDAFQRQVGKEVAHPGVGNDFDDEHAKKYYTYYQWVCFVLFFQVRRLLVMSAILLHPAGREGKRGGGDGDVPRFIIRLLLLLLFALSERPACCA